nr:SprT-like family [Klebsiella pneumoniae]
MRIASWNAAMRNRRWSTSSVVLPPAPPAGENEIRLNPVLLLENQREFIDEVVPHELAHLLVWQHFGRVAPHGKEWKWMMESVLGVPARRTHRFELASVRQNTFPYRCRCQQHQLTVRRHNRVVRGEATYRCVRCGDLLVAEK